MNGLTDMIADCTTISALAKLQEAPKWKND